MIRHDFGDIHDALNKMILSEVRTALSLLPGKSMESDATRVPLCRIVVSDSGDYLPYDLSVRRIWLDDEDELHFSEYEAHYNSSQEWTEYDDLLDISDFAYLIDQIAEQVEGDKTYNLPNMSVVTCGFCPEFCLKAAVDKTVND